MSNNSQVHPAQKYIDLRARNLDFFRRHYPGVFEYFNTYEMQHLKVDILPELDEIDLIVDNKHLYSSKATSFAKTEVAAFLSQYDYGSKIKSFPPLGRDTYKTIQRFFNRSVAELYDLYYSKDRKFEGYILGNFFPLIVFMGVGIGKHVDIMCRIRDIHHAVIFESDMDRFAASLYSIDWQALASPFLEDESRSLTFVLVPGRKEKEELYPHLWNSLLKFCPLFPVTTLFYNHLGDTNHSWLAEKVSSDLYVHLFSFGNLDDELNQLNNALHNFKRGGKLFRKPEVDLSDVPVCIVGSGPSLDERIDDLRAIQDKAIIISSGTALRALWHHGIKPDFQVELESDFNTYAAQNLMEDKAFMKSVRLIGAAQLNPLTIDLFGDCRLFFKEDGALAEWYGKNVSPIPNATPTCTNASLALAFHLKFGQVFLFGLDYGFPDSQAHHAAGSVYYKEQIREGFEANHKEVFEMPAADGGKIFSTHFLFASKRRIDNLLASQKSIEIFNCSNGAVLPVLWLEPGSVREKIKVSEINKSAIINSIFAENNPIVSAQLLNTVTDRVGSKLSDLTSTIKKKALKNPLSNDQDFTDLCSLIGAYLSELEQDNRSIYYFIRGTLWHFLLAGYTHVFSMGEEGQADYLAEWKKLFLNLIELAEQRTLTVLNRNVEVAKDQMVNQTISRHLVDEFQWEYMGYSIIDGETVIDGDGFEFEFLGYCFDGDKFIPYEG